MHIRMRTSNTNYLHPQGAEARGVLARDESIQGVRYFLNLFLID